MKVSFHPKAEEEFYEAIEYYEECQDGLGLEFAKEVFATIERIVNFSQAWSKICENIRRCLVNRFPYGIIYTIQNDEIIILAVMHLNRKPKYWKERAKENI